uniref:E3 ubiquitin-protein ligase BRE1B n=1 Tax=Lygus hesperus TaxID=30085 RepID=A0A0A9WCJ4_LYGHE
MKIALAIVVCLAVSALCDVEDDVSAKSEKLMIESTHLLKDANNKDVSRAEIRERILAALERLKKRIVRLHERILKWFNNEPPSYILLLHDFIMRVLNRIQTRLNKSLLESKNPKLSGEQ